MHIPIYPFDASPEQLEANLDSYVDQFVASLRSFFLVMPKGRAFVDFERFQQAYKTLLEKTKNFANLSPESALEAIEKDPMALVVLRTILGFTPPEFAYIASINSGVEIDQSSARRLDKRAREGLPLLTRTTPETQQQVRALVRAAIELIEKGPPSAEPGTIHRLDKADTQKGLVSLQEFVRNRVPYEVLLYERLLGRPFASHRDAVSEQVGDVLESAVRDKLESEQIPYHKAGMGERFEDMDQAPGFFVPNQFQPAVLIEAKLAEDDGTARDKVTRVQHLAELRDRRLREGQPAFEVIACVDGRGFGGRREDVKKLLIATKGKLFTLQTIEYIIDSTGLKNYRGQGLVI